MAKEFAKKFYNSAKWKKCKKAYIDNRMLIDGGMCEECHERLGEIVHHEERLTEDNIDNEWISLNPEKLRYVCHSCHDEYEGHGVHGKGIKNKRTCLFDENGQPISIRAIDRQSPPALRLR